MNYYSDYYWENGIPIGLKKSEKGAYKIISDPYRKRFSIEEYHHENLSRVIYDSIFLDFRRLTLMDQIAWEKTSLNQKEHLIRDQDDRAILIESYHFEGERCRHCEIKSIHGVEVGFQHILYTSLGNPFNGVILYDRNRHPVLAKEYQVDKKTETFTEILKETKNMRLWPNLDSVNKI